MIDIITAGIFLISIFAFKIRTKIFDFIFIANKAFLNDSGHPITVPKDGTRFLMKHGITKKQDTTITISDGSITDAYIHYLKTEWEEYYQVRTESHYSGMGISKLEVGDIRDVEIYEFYGNILINLDYRKFWDKSWLPKGNDFGGDIIKREG